MSMYDEDSYIHVPRKHRLNKFLTLICKALGPKASECSVKSNNVCYIRIAFVVYVILTNFIIMYGVLTR